VEPVLIQYTFMVGNNLNAIVKVRVFHRYLQPRGKTDVHFVTQ